MLYWGPPTKKPKAQKAWDALCARFRQMAKRYKKRSSAHRAAIYSDMGEVAGSKRVIDRDPELKRAALLNISKANGWPEARVKSKRFRLTNELVAMATGAQTRGSRQLASKRGQVIDLLLHDDVRPKNFVKEIKRRGGIEQILDRRRPRKRARELQTTEKVTVEFGSADYQKLRETSEGHHISFVAAKVTARRLRVTSFNPLGSSRQAEEESCDSDE
jgi:hypothetical protein